MKSTIVLLSIAIALFVAVMPVQAAPLNDDIKPVCTSSSTWLDKLLGKCVDLDNAGNDDTSVTVFTEAPTPTVNPTAEPTDFPTMDACKNWTRFLYPECKDN